MCLSTFIQGRDQFDVLASYEADKKKLRLLVRRVKRYAESECAVLAGRLHAITGWPIVALMDRTGTHPWPLHYCVKNPQGQFVDSYGACPSVLKGLIFSRYGLTNAQLVDWPPGKCFTKLSYSTRRTVNDFLVSPWMLAVVPPAVRLAKPLVYR